MRIFVDRVGKRARRQSFSLFETENARGISKFTGCIHRGRFTVRRLVNVRLPRQRHFRQILDVIAPDGQLFPRSNGRLPTNPRFLSTAIIYFSYLGEAYTKTRECSKQIMVMQEKDRFSLLVTLI